MTSSVMPSARRLACSSTPRLSNGRTATAGAAASAGRLAPRKCQAPTATAISAGSQKRQPRAAFWLGRLRRHHGLRLGGHAHLQRVDADRPFDVLELGRAEVGDGHVEPAAHLTVGVFRQTDRARLTNTLQARGDIDAVAHEVAVAFLDHVAEMNADAKLDATLGRQAGVALDHAVLHFDRAAHGVDHAAEFNHAAVAGAFDDAAVMEGDRRINQVAAERPEPRQNAILVRAREPAVADNIRHQNRRELPGLAH